MVEDDALSLEPCEHTITALVALLGEPSLMFVDDQGPGLPASHHCGWACGCEAGNVHGICLEEGWLLETCSAHRGSPVIESAQAG
jgi:hypothetical protein